MKRSLHERGYTLTELMMVVAITGILFAAGPPMLVQMQNFYLMTNARQAIERDARVSLDTVNRFVRQGQAGTINIDTPKSTGTNKPCDEGTSGSNMGGIYSRISFTLIDGRQVQFFQSGNNLCQSIGTDSTNATIVTSVLSNNLDYIGFGTPQTDNPTIIQVSMTMSKSIQLGKTKVLELTIQKVRVMN